jgi:NAD(P)-dependent dehydrogenase (short-subunit alcohol dehydrogenase family)
MHDRAEKIEEVDACAAEVFQTNVTGNLHLFNLFVPLVKKGKAKKVIAISSGVADIDLTNQCEIDVGPLYAASKAAMNIIVAKFNAEYKKEGILFLSISPGLVEVGRYADGAYLYSQSWGRPSS